jgi:hypothetical protein
MFDGKEIIVCLMRVVVDCMLVGCVFLRWMLACKSPSLIVMVGIGSWWNFSFIFALGNML